MPAMLKYSYIKAYHKCYVNGNGALFIQTAEGNSLMDNKETEKLYSEGNKKKTGLKGAVLAGFFWRFMERGGTSLVEFVVQTILARWFLSPEDFATVALISIFINISNICIQAGFNTALIQKKDTDDDDCSSVFLLSLGLSIVFYIILFFCAPLIASFYDKPILTAVLRVQALTLIMGAFSTVPNAILTKRMEFKKIFYRTIGATVCSAVVGLVMAFNEFGLWTIVGQTLTVNFVGAIFLWFSVKWRPRLVFSKGKIRSLFGFGGKILGSNLINTVYANIVPLFMEKVYAGGTLGYYNKARTIPEKLTENINGTISTVIFPSLSTVQNDKVRVKELTRRFIVTSSFIMFAMMAGLIATARPLVLLWLTDKWAMSIPMMQFVCISYAFIPINNANLQAISAMGRSDIYIKLEIIKDTIGVVLLGGAFAVSVFCGLGEKGIFLVLAVQALISVISVIVNAVPNKKLLDYSLKEQFCDILPSLTLAIVMGVLTWAITLLNLPNWLTLVIQLVFGVTFYLGTARILKFECLSYLMSTLKEIMNRRKRK